MTPTKVNENVGGYRHFSTSLATLSLPSFFSPVLCRVPSTPALYMGQSFESVETPAAFRAPPLTVSGSAPTSRANRARGTKAVKERRHRGIVAPFGFGAAGQSSGRLRGSG